MKKILSLIAISLLAFIPVVNTQAKSAEFLLNVNVYNATGSNGSIYMSGANPDKCHRLHR